MQAVWAGCHPLSFLVVNVYLEMPRCHRFLDQLLNRFLAGAPTHFQAMPTLERRGFGQAPQGCAFVLDLASFLAALPHCAACPMNQSDSGVRGVLSAAARASHRERLNVHVRLRHAE